MAEKRKLLDDHASTVFEDALRARWPGAARYWEADIELDAVRLEGERLVVTEVKWTSLLKAARKARLAAMKSRFQKTRLGQKYPNARFEVLDASELRALADDE